MRTAEINRKTNETDISLRLEAEGSGKVYVDSGVGFLNHMLTLFAAHGRFGLTLTCRGDTEVDDHHSVEDVGIALGQAFAQLVGDKRGLKRYGSTILPMDEALILTAVDFSGRAHLTFDVRLPAQKVGTFDTELTEEFWQAFVREAGCALHIREISGKNTHHIIEGIFKSAGRSIREATALDPACAGQVPSTKGVL